MIKLFNRDCIEFLRTLPDDSVDMCLTDPPYGTTVCKWDSVVPFEPMWEQLKRVVKDNGAIVLFGKEPFSSILRCSNLEMFKYDWIWKKDTKSNFPQAGHQPLNNIELVHVFSKGYARNFPANSDKLNQIMSYYPQMVEGKEYSLPKESKTTAIFGENHRRGRYKHKEKDTTKRFPFNTLEFKTDKDKFHPTQKPVALLEYLINTYTLEHETVLDFTMGSGSTGVACVNTNRRFIGCELNDVYFKIAQERINNLGGRNA
jgi:DNA modification methylase